jgi:hypothetical protein
MTELLSANCSYCFWAGSSSQPLNPEPSQEISTQNKQLAEQLSSFRNSPYGDPPIADSMLEFITRET